MRRRLPSLNALKAFEASARHESFTSAAAELFVTQGAVSQQVKALEDELGLRLFSREGRMVKLTEAGRGYLEVVRDAFDRLASGTERLLQRQSSGVLNISTSPNFAAKWLVHRLGRFSEAHPEIELRISASMQHVDFARDETDVAVAHGDWPGMSVTRLCKEEIFPVCAPQLLRGRRGLKVPCDLAHHPLLHVNDHSLWQRWLEHHGVTVVDGGVDRHARLVEEGPARAVQGQGVAMARTALAAWDLLGGRLARPFREAMDAPFAMWIVSPKVTAELPKIAIFRDWLLAEAAEDTRRLRLARPAKVP
jgi:LysR family transcriptional regulator, glycine cleavage system transcriptional activator